MTRHPIRKFFLLALIYTIIIFGIFTLQFRNRSVFSENFGVLRLTLSENKAQDSSIKYSDKFIVSCRGITLYSDNDSHIQVTYSNGTKASPAFTDWKKISDTSFELFFSDNISLIFEATGPEHKSLSTSAKMPASVKELSIPYSYSGSYTITELTDTKAILRSKELYTILASPLLTKNRIAFLQNKTVTTYSEYNPVQAFTFASVSDLSTEQDTLYQQFIRQIRSVTASIPASELETSDENTVSAYLAEFGRQGRFAEGVANIPSSFKTGTKRTYLTAPQLNNLASMQRSLTMYNENLAYRMNLTFSKASLDIFEVDNLHAFLMRQSSETAAKLLRLPSEHPELIPTIMQASGIIQTYSSLSEASSKLKDYLAPAVETSLKIIQDNCSMQDGLIYLTENSSPVSLIKAAHIASALLDYGHVSNNPMYANVAKLILLAHKGSQLDSATAASLYMLLEKDNHYIPHEIILRSGGKPMFWAWTIAKSMTCSYDATEEVLTFTAEFPQDENHYMILTGIEPFRNIEIYGMQFRTDPRFETYNSSGYVYNAKTKTLLLKYRMRQPKEVIRLSYKAPQETPVIEKTESNAPEATQTESGSETQTTSADSEASEE